MLPSGFRSGRKLCQIYAKPVADGCKCLPATARKCLILLAPAGQEHPSEPLNCSHNPLVVGSSPTRPTTLACRVDSSTNDMFCDPTRSVCFWSLHRALQSWLELTVCLQGLTQESNQKKANFKGRQEIML